MVNAIWDMLTNNDMYSNIETIISVLFSVIGTFIIMINIDKIFGTKETREAEMERRIWHRNKK
jgi:ammonia channel protein AmtB